MVESANEEAYVSNPTYWCDRCLMMELWQHLNSYDTAVITQPSCLPEQLGTKRHIM